MEEVEHLVEVLTKTKKALETNDSPSLNELSNQTIHSASYIQDPGSIAIAVIIYSLSKLIERGDNNKIKRWPLFVKKTNSYFELAIVALNSGNFSVYETYLEKIRGNIEAISVNLRPYIEEVLRKAAINKASKIYEHGISQGQTSRLLGISQWELSEYLGQKSIEIKDFENPLSVKKRAQMALEFFS